MLWWMLIKAASKTVQLMVVREGTLLGSIYCFDFVMLQFLCLSTLNYIYNNISAMLCAL